MRSRPGDSPVPSFLHHTSGARSCSTGAEQTEGAGDSIWRSHRSSPQQRGTSAVQPPPARPEGRPAPTAPSTGESGATHQIQGRRPGNQRYLRGCRPAGPRHHHHWGRMAPGGALRWRRGKGRRTREGLGRLGFGRPRVAHSGRRESRGEGGFLWRPRGTFEVVFTT